MTRLNATYENAIIAWISGNVTGLSGNVWWDKQDHPRDTLPYAVVNMLPPVDETGNAPVETHMTDDTYKKVHRFRITVSVNIIANDSYYAKMEQLTRSLDVEGVRTALKTAGLYFRYAEDAQDLTTLLDTAYEFRVQKDFIFAYATDNNDTVKEIQRVIFEADLGGQTIEVDETTT